MEAVPVRCCAQHGKHRASALPEGAPSCGVMWLGWPKGGEAPAERQDGEVQTQEVSSV